MKDKTLGYFFKVGNFIFDCGLKPRDIAVYCCICRHVNNNTGVAFPSRRTIARECGIGKVDTVDKALKHLCELGLLSASHQYAPNGGFKSNVYTLSDFGDKGSPHMRDSNKKN